MKDNVIKALKESYKCRMMWFIACDYRQFQSDIQQLSNAGVTIHKLDTRLKEIRNLFRWSAECEDNDEIMDQLDNFKNTLISWDDMAEIICKNVLGEQYDN